MTSRRLLTRLLLLWLAAGSALWLGWMVLGQLGHPLLWNDEGYTAEFGRRVTVHGFPKVRDGGNVLYGLDANVAVGTKEGLDAYLGTPWAHYYVAALGVIWAAETPDLHEKTARLRTPFAAAGLLAVLLFVAAGRRVLAGGGHRALLTLAVLVSCGTSISLVLHLREVRYYALATLLTAALVWLEAAPPTARRAVRVARDGLRVGLLVLLFLTFFPSFFAMLAALAADRIWTALRAEAGSDARRRDLAREMAPLLLAALCGVPLMLFFETVPIARALSAAADFSASSYFAHLGRAVVHLSTQELAVAAFAMRVLLPAVDRPPGPRPPDRRLADLLWLFTLASLLLGARNPVFFERYYVALGPVLALACGLDALHLWEAWPPRTAARGRALQLGVLLAAVAAVAVARAPFVAARVQELRDPPRGPLDYVIPYLADRFEDPSELVIATNYEEPVLMYYLGSRVVVGFNGANLRHERTMRPDVIVPRRRWGRHKRILAEMLSEGDFERVRFPVADLQYNNRPSLGEHRFRNDVPESLDDWMEIFVRTGSR